MIPKFKVWDKRNERMIEWIDLDFSKDNGEDFIIVFEPTGIVRDAIISPILLQSTGLFDKNGKEIFDGDILSVSKNHNKTDSRVFNDEKVNYRVEFLNYDDMEAYADIEHYGWCATGSIDKWSTRCTLIDAVKLWDAEIMGNKFEHPHLLEEE